MHEQILTDHQFIVVISNVDRGATLLAIEMCCRLEVALNQVDLGAINIQNRAVKADRQRHLFELEAPP